MFMSAIIDASLIRSMAIALVTCVKVVAKAMTKTLKNVTTRRITKVYRDGSRRQSSHNLMSCGTAFLCLTDNLSKETVVSGPTALPCPASRT